MVTRQTQTQTLVSCPCSSTLSVAVNTHEVPKPSTFQPVRSLHFCSTCRAIRCHKCSVNQIQTKFCPRCFYTVPSTQNGILDTIPYCPRNCFCCPRCDNFLQVTSKTMARKDDPSKIDGKEFSWICKLCNWKQNSGLITKPQPLVQIVKNLQRKSFESSHKLEEFYTKQKIGLQYIESNNNERLKMKNVLIGTLSSMEIARLSKCKTLDEFIDYIKGPNDIIVKDDYQSDKISETTLNAPQFQFLRTKNIRKCRSCNEVLSAPSTDPLSTKYSIKNDLYNIFPIITTNIPLESHKFRGGPEISTKIQSGLNFVLISLQNFQKKEVEIKLSTFEYFDLALRELNDHQKVSAAIQVSFPPTQVTIGPASEKLNKPEVVATTIPTIQLTELTKVSQIEKLKRDPDILKRLTYEALSVRDREEVELAMDMGDAVLDKGINWCTLLVKVTLLKSVTDETKIDLPLFMTVKTDEKEIGTWIKIPLVYTDTYN